MILILYEGSTLDEDQERLHHHNEEESCLKETIEKTNDIIEEVRLDLAIEDKCIQDMGHTFMTPFSISDKYYINEIEIHTYHERVQHTTQFQENF